MKTARILLATGIAAGLLSMSGNLAVLVQTAVSGKVGTLAGGDFALRYNEIECIGDGINPYDISDGSKSSDVFRSWIYGIRQHQSGTKSVGGYPPWEYPLFAPFFLLPFSASFAVYTVLQLLAVVAGGFLAYGLAKRNRLDDHAALFVAFSPLLLASAFNRCLNIGNFGIFLGVGVFALAECLNRKKDVLAGVLLSLLWIKPHLLLFVAIPLLTAGKFKSLAIAVGLCLFLSIPASCFIGQSPVSLMMDVFMRHSGQTFQQLALLPGRISIPAISFLTPQGALVLLLVFYSVATFFISRRLSKAECDWTIRLAPCAVIAPIWSYSRSHDMSIFLLPVSLAITGLIASLHNPPPHTPHTRTERGGSPLAIPGGIWIYSIAALSLVSVVFDTGDTTRSRFPELVASKFSSLNVPMLKNVCDWIVSLQTRDHALVPFYILFNWAALISWAVALTKIRSHSPNRNHLRRMDDRDFGPCGDRNAERAESVIEN